MVRGGRSKDCIHISKGGGDLNDIMCDLVSFPLEPGGLNCSLVI